MTTQHRFALWTAVVASASLLGVALATVVVVSGVLARSLDQDLAASVRAAAGPSTAPTTLAELCSTIRTSIGATAPDQYVSVAAPSGNERCRSDLRRPALPHHAFKVRPSEKPEGSSAEAEPNQGPDSSPKRVVRYTTMHIGGEQMRVASTATPSARIAAVAPTTQNRKTIRLLALVLAAISLIGMVVAVLAGATTARRATRQLDELISSLAEGIADARTGDRITAVGAKDLDRIATAFNELLGRMEVLAAAQRQLVADSAHQLRTPLTGARTNVQVLNRLSEDAPEREQILADVSVQLAELSALVDDVVELASIDERWGAGVAMQSVDISRVVEDAIDRARLRHPGRDIICSTEPYTLMGDADLIERAIANLLDNALAWAAPGSPVEVTQNGCAVSVRDHGPGFAATDLPQVFQAFFRGRAARRHPGSGLGLAFVERVAHLHGGVAHASNHEDGGGVVTLSVPGGHSKETHREP